MEKTLPQTALILSESGLELGRLDGMIAPQPGGRIGGDITPVGDRLIIGDPTCRYSAQSELVRCAVNPAGPCQGCLHFQRRSPA